jgi:hypothetical protein
MFGEVTEKLPKLQYITFSQIKSFVRVPVYVNSNIKALDVGKYIFKTDHESDIVIPSINTECSAGL